MAITNGPCTLLESGNGFWQQEKQLAYLPTYKPSIEQTYTCTLFIIILIMKTSKLDC